MTNGSMYYYMLLCDRLLDGNLCNCQMLSFAITPKVISRVGVLLDKTKGEQFEMQRFICK